MRTFDRLVEFDEKSREYPIRTLVRTAGPRAYHWRCRTTLDQGEEGACVGFAWAHDLIARPVETPATAENAHGFYRRAQFFDDWEGEDYEGTSVLAGAKAMQEAGYLGEYRWAFGLDDLVMAVGRMGPAVLGLNWYEGMYEPDSAGYLRPSGDLLGGHSILCNSVSLLHQRFGLQNSWGPGWGNKGRAWVTFADMDRLLHEQGEACIPLQRQEIVT